MKLIAPYPEALDFCRVRYAEIVENSLFGGTSFDAALEGPSFFRLVQLEDNQVIGMIGLEAIRWIDRAASLSGAIAPDFRGDGHAIPAIKLMLEEAHNTLNLRKISMTTLAGSPAHKACAKVGFQEEGTLKHEKFINGEYHDGVILSYIFDEVH